MSLNVQRNLTYLNRYVYESEQTHHFKAEQLDWEKLEAVGIRRKELEKDGNLDLLLQGAETGVTTLNLKTPVFSLTMDATLKLEVEPDGRPVIGINGIRPMEE